LEFAVEVFEFALHEESEGGFGDVVGDAFGGGVSAVGGAEGVVDVDFGGACELFGEVGVVGFLGGVEAGVL
jgi:hypothetical protein